MSLYSDYQVNTHLEKQVFPHTLLSSLWKELCHLKTSHAVITVSLESDTMPYLCFIVFVAFQVKLRYSNIFK